VAFSHPAWLLGLLALPLAGAWMAWSYALRRRRLARFADPAFWPAVAGEVAWGRRKWRMALRLAVLAFLILAAARPQWGAKERPLVREGSDLIVCLDVSTSMLARDIAPSRLERAREQIKALIRNLRGDRVGLVVFAGESFVQCPLTLDYALASHLLDSVGPDTVSVQGTRIGGAIDTARQAFERSGTGSKAIILVTDGEDQGSNPIEAAERAAKEDILIMTIGIGTPGGAPIRLAAGAYKEAREGRKVTSRLDIETLRKIALISGGKAAVTDRSGNMDLEAIYSQIQSLQKQKMDSMQVSLMEDRYQWPLAAAILLLVAELLLGERTRRRRKAGGQPMSAASMFVLLAVWSAMPGGGGGGARAEWYDFGNKPARVCQEGNTAFQKEKFDEARGKYLDAGALAPDRAEPRINEGLVLAKQDKLSDAAAALQSAAMMAHGNPALRARALYNAGTLHAQAAQQLAEKKQKDDAVREAIQAVDLLRQASELDPKSSSARQNLTEARNLLQMLLQPPPQQDQQQDKDKNQPYDKEQNSTDTQNQDQAKSDKNDKDKSEKDKQESAQNQQNQDNKEQQQQAQKDKEQQQKDSEKKDSEQKESEQQQESAAAQPTPTPGAQDAQAAKPEEKKDSDADKNAQAAQPGNQDQAATDNEMNRQNALLLLSTLPEEDPQAMKRLFRGQGVPMRMEKDW